MVSLFELFFEYFPPWLGPLFMLIGVVIVIIEVSFASHTMKVPTPFYMDRIEDPGLTDADLKSLSREAAFTSVAVFCLVFVIKYPDYVRYIAYACIIAGNIIEAGSTVRFLNNIRIAVSDHRLPTGAGLFSKFGLILVCYLMISIFVSTYIVFLIYSGANIRIYQSFRLWYTLITVSIATAGLYWKYESLVSYGWPVYLIFGASFVFIGSDIYNVQHVTTEVIVILLGYIIYHIYYIWYVYVFIILGNYKMRS